MKIQKSTIVLIAVAAVLVLWGVSSYNKLVSAQEEVNKAWSNVEATYQRRMDLINQLVPIVESNAKIEKNALKEVIEMRASATQLKLSVDDLTDENLEKFQKAQDQLGGSLSRLMAVSEAYPELKFNERFQDLQVQVEGNENRIIEARRVYNEVATTYNIKIRRFPTNLLAGIFAFERKGLFQASEGADKAPEIKINID